MATKRTDISDELIASLQEAVEIVTSEHERRLGHSERLLSASDGVPRRVEAIVPQPGYRLAVTWRDGDRTVVDFSGDVSSGGIWAELRDAAKFARARVAEHGAVLEWPEPSGPDGAPRIDIDAEGLYAMSLEQRAQPRVKPLRHAIFNVSKPT